MRSGIDQPAGPQPGVRFAPRGIAPRGERIAIELWLCEAMTVSAAPRQYEPGWRANDPPESLVEQLAHVREDVTGVIDRT